MADFRKMTVEGLREVARKLLGPGHSRLKTKADLLAALEAVGKDRKASAAKAPPAPKAGRAAKAAPAAKPPPAAKAAPAAKFRPRKSAKTIPAARPGRGGGTAAQAGEAVDKPMRGGKSRSAGGAVARARNAVKEAVSDMAEKVRAAVAPSPQDPDAPARKRPGKIATAMAGAAAGIAAVARSGRRAGTRGSRPGEGPVDPAGFFVARVRGEDAVREAPHPMTETAEEAATAANVVEGGVDEEAEAAGGDAGLPGNGHDEGLGELPWGYGDDAFVALPRDPRTLFLYWDLAQPTVHAGFEGLDHPRVQLWIYARADGGWERVRTVDFALEAHGYYVHELDPGRVYRAEIRAVDRLGHDRVLGRASNEMMLPPLGLSPVIDDRFIRIPWDLPLGRLLGPGHAGAPFSEEARALLARLSDWSRFAARGGAGGGGSAGGIGGRSSTAPTSPSSGFGGGGGA